MAGTPSAGRASGSAPGPSIWVSFILIFAILILAADASMASPSNPEMRRLGFQERPVMMPLGAGAAASAESELPAGPEIEPGYSPILLPAADAILLDPPADPSSAAIAAELQEIRDLQAGATEEAMERVAFWTSVPSSVRWNEIARSLVIKYQTDPPMASRVYALVSVAQHDGLVAAGANAGLFSRPPPGSLDPGVTLLDPKSAQSGGLLGGAATEAAAQENGAQGTAAVETATSSYPSEGAVVGAASAAVLAYLYPDESAYLEGLLRDQEEALLLAGAAFPSDVEAAALLGRMVAEVVIDHARRDGSDLVGEVTVPVGPGYWTGDDPLRPLWDKVTPWTTDDISRYRPGPPPAYGSPEFAASLEEVRRIADGRTEGERRIAEFWADGPGTYTPPGHWNAIACQLIEDRGLGELESARTLAVLNIALMDAGISCWDAKYHYWLLRPWMADPEINTSVARPPFPSYTSGHASFSGAASAVLGCIFPDDGDEIAAMAEEAAASRLYGGIHYRFDNEEGLRSGRMIGRAAVDMVMKEGC